MRSRLRRGQNIAGLILALGEASHAANRRRVPTAPVAAMGSFDQISQFRTF
jgi:hypothetical protein